MDLNVYNYLLTNYMPNPANKNVAHKNSELRTILSDIANRTKKSPIYLVKLSDEMQSYALNVKDSAMSLGSAIDELADKSTDSIFSQRKAYSSDEDQVGVEIDTDDYDNLPGEFSLLVKNTAKPQINETKEFYDTSKSLDAGTYRFQIQIDDDAYDFQYNIKNDANHRDVIGGLSDFITKAHIGIEASPISREAGKIAMRLESVSTGSASGELNMKFMDKKDNASGIGLVEYYGMNRVVQEPQNAIIEIDGEEHYSTGNQIRYGDALNVSFKKVGDEASNISYLPNTDAILGGVKNVVSNYNQMVKSSYDYSGQENSMPKLVREMQAVFYPYRSEMEACGISIDSKGYMNVDDSLAEQATLDGSFKELFGGENDLGNRIKNKMGAVKVDPMEYVNKKVVSYPNFSKPPIGYSYTTSLYSGMLFNSYC